jgi:hypothetical protein
VLRRRRRRKKKCHLSLGLPWNPEYPPQLLLQPSPVHVVTKRSQQGEEIAEKEIDSAFY